MHKGAAKTPGRLRRPTRTMWSAAAIGFLEPLMLHATASVEPAGIWPRRSLAAAAPRGPPLLRKCNRPLRISPNKPSRANRLRVFRRDRGRTGGRQRGREEAITGGAP